MPTSSDQETQAREGERDSASGSWWRWLWLLPLIYILGIGPAAHIHKAFPATAKPIEAVYTPLVLVCRKSPPLQAALEWYLTKVWRYPAPPHK